MGILSTLRQSTQCPPSGVHAYIDTPDFEYDTWLRYLSANDLAIGSVKNLTKPPKVAIIGGGVSGLCAAYELSRAGCVVEVFEAASEVGGRCASYVFDPSSTDIAELGAMRFPPTQFILSFYLESLGLVLGGLLQLA